MYHDSSLFSKQKKILWLIWTFKLIFRSRCCHSIQLSFQTKVQKLWGSEKSTAFTTINPDSFLKCVFLLVSRTSTLLVFFLSPRVCLMKTLQSVLLFLMSVSSLTTQPFLSDPGVFIQSLALNYLCLPKNTKITSLILIFPIKSIWA